MQASSTMTRNVIVVPPELSLHAAWLVMQRERIRHLPVVRAGALLGILSDRDILLRAKLDANENIRVPADSVATAMTTAPITTEADTSVTTIVELMTERKIDAIPIVHGLRLVGLVTTTDLILLLIHREQDQRLPFDFKLEEASAAPA